MCPDVHAWVYVLKSRRKTERKALMCIVLKLCGWVCNRALQIGFVASFCSKLSDTVSSEVGKAYGKTTYLITTFQLVPRGTEGAVSVEGTAAGILAAFLFSAVALLAGQVRWGDGARVC